MKIVKRRRKTFFSSLAIIFLFAFCCCRDRHTRYVMSPMLTHKSLRLHSHDEPSFNRVFISCESATFVWDCENQGKKIARFLHSLSTRVSELFHPRPSHNIASHPSQSRQALHAYSFIHYTTDTFRPPYTRIIQSDNPQFDLQNFSILTQSQHWAEIKSTWSIVLSLPLFKHSTWTLLQLTIEGIGRMWTC